MEAIEHEPETGWEDTQPSLFDPAEVASEAYRLPDRAVLRRSVATGKATAEQSGWTAADDARCPAQARAVT